MVLDLSINSLKKSRSQGSRSHQDTFKRCLWCETRELIKELVDVITKNRICREDSKIFIEACSLWVVVTGTHMNITANTAAFLTDYQRELCVGLKSNETVHNVNSSIFKLASPANVCLFIKPRSNFNNCQYLLASFSSFNQSCHDG